jgi:excisionase family DNA binding protein
METEKTRPGARCWTVSQAAALLGLPPKGLYTAIARGHVPCIRIGGRVLVPKEQLDALIEGKS